jgi:hypothetical protein
MRYTRIFLFVCVFALASTISALARPLERGLVETSVTLERDSTGISRGTAISTSTTWNTFCEFILPFLLEKGYEPPAYVCN